MHRCLQIPEIVDHIIDFLGLTKIRKDLDTIGHLGTRKRKDALAVALTCRQFLEPGLDALWHSMCSPVPLLNFLVPADMSIDYLQNLRFNEETAPHDVLTLITSCLSSVRNGMNRLFYYSHRIKYLQVSSLDGFPAILFFVLRESYPSIVLTPSLRGLVWQHPNIHAFRCIDFFAGPLVQRLDIWLYPWPEEGAELLRLAMSFIRHSCLQLEDANIFNEAEYIASEARHNPEADLNTVNFVIFSLPPVSQLSISAEISADTLASLSQMPNLQSLGGGQFEDPPYAVSWVFAIPPKPNFPALQKLDLCGSPLTEYIKLIRSLSSSTNLTSLRFIYNPFAGPTIIQEFFQTVGECCSPRTLTDIEFSAVSFRPDDEESTILEGSLQSAVFVPILSFRGMKSFAFCPGDYEGWDEDLLKRLATAWPELEVLLIRLPDSARFRLESLFDLAKNCPRLGRVCVPLQRAPGSAGFPQRDWDHGRMGPPPRVTVALRDQPFELSEDVVAYLKDIFPNIVIPKRAIWERGR